MEPERILLIYDYLTRNAAEPPGVTIQDIRSHLASSADIEMPSPLTVRRDLERLTTAGYNIVRTNGAHNTAYYYISGSGFTFNEIRFIVDSVSINKFLSAEEKTRLIRKFEVLCSEKDVRRLISRVKVNRSRLTNSDLLKNLEAVHRIIGEQCKIQFAYGKHDENGEISYYSKKRDMIPCEVVYFNERFYLYCMDENTEERRIYRIDRMKDIRMGEKPRRRLKLPAPEGADVDIFKPERYESVLLRVRRVLLDDMLETFGEFADIRKTPVGQGWICIQARVGISDGFYRWAMRYGEDLEILAPAEIRACFAEKLRNVSALYQETEGRSMEPSGLNE